MTEKKIIAVVGATGAQGGGLVRAILNDPDGGFAARAITRNADSPKAQELASLGASPRASIFLHEAARAHAFMRHRGYVTPEDVKAIGMDVLRHRIIRTYEAEAEEVSSEQIVRRIFDAVEVP